MTPILCLFGEELTRQNPFTKPDARPAGLELARARWSMRPPEDHRKAVHAVFEAMLQSRVCLRSYEELLAGRPLDVGIERIGPEHAGE